MTQISRANLGWWGQTQQGSKHENLNSVYKKKQQAPSSKQMALNKLYNLDIAPEDSQVTAFYYHKTLALECTLSLFCLLTIVLAAMGYFLLGHYNESRILKGYNLILIFSILGAVNLVLISLCRIKWMRAKKERMVSITNIIFFMVVRVLLFAPCPLYYLSQHTIALSTNKGTEQIPLNVIFIIYMMVIRGYHIGMFAIHTALYYGSRPDRLSRLYTVNFGTFNAVRFLINEKPVMFCTVGCLVNFLAFALIMLLVEGTFNPSLSQFDSCLHFVLTTQMTVGYGDISAVSTLGKLVTYAAVIAGAVISSFLVILFKKHMVLTNAEEQARDMYNSLEVETQIRGLNVLRIEKEMAYLNSRFNPAKAQDMKNDLERVRYENKMAKYYLGLRDRNPRKSLLWAYTEVNRTLRLIQEKTLLIHKCVQTVNKSFESCKDIKVSRFRDLKKQMLNEISQNQLRNQSANGQICHSKIQSPQKELSETRSHSKTSNSRKFYVPAEKIGQIEEYFRSKKTQLNKIRPGKIVTQSKLKSKVKKVLEPKTKGIRFDLRKIKIAADNPIKP